MTPEELDRRYTYHAPDDETRALHDTVRAQEKQFAEFMDSMLEDSREKSLMLTKLEEAMFWAHAHIARNVSHKYVPNRENVGPGEGTRCLTCGRPEHGHA
jgi:hypothetical protein